jgi:hypothetical protein
MNTLRLASTSLVLLLAASIAAAQDTRPAGDSNNDGGGRRRSSREERRQGREGNVERDTGGTGGAASSSSSAAPASASASSANRYDVLVENNIFLKDRRSAGRPTTDASTRPVARPSTPEQSVYLTGVIFEDGAFRAYFENQAEGAPVLRVSVGDAIARGRVVEIAIDSLAYASTDGRLQWVEIGNDLTGTPRPAAGAAGAAGAAASATPPAAGGAGAAPTAPTDPALLSIQERMRLRAQQERGGGGGGGR